MPSMAQLQEWVEKKHNQASFTRSESWLKASAQLGMREVNQMGVSILLELDGPSSEGFEEVSSIDVLPHGSGNGCHLFGHGDHLASGLGEVVADGCSSAGSALVSRADKGKEGDNPNKMW